MPSTSIKEQLAAAAERAEYESNQSHRLGVVLRHVVLGKADAVERFTADGDRYELRLYAATRCEGGYVLIVTRFKSGDAATRVVSLDEEYRYWTQWIPIGKCGDDRIKMRDAVYHLHAERTRILVSAQRSASLLV